MLLNSDEEVGLGAAFRRQRRVLLALMLRNMRTRFFGSGLGFLLAIAWPMTHITAFVAVSVFRGRQAPIGESAALFYATGAATFQAFSYLANFTMRSISSSRPLLGFPSVKLLDAMFAASLLEILSCCTVTLIVLVIGASLGIDVMPRNIEEAFCAYGSAILLGIGIGMLNSIMVMVVPMWMVIFGLARITLYVSSGVLFLPDKLPEPLRSLMGYNPLAQSLEWMRSAYYEGIGVGFLDKPYVLKFGVGAIFLGLVCERFMRGYLLR
ncbi:MULTISPECIES: ABC transporter permease [Methylosinus]|uniref:ABC transporter n=1 Tax=Methylosinus trichosporium (strain ATCC 35070 / NCIMB 11131 / UNIQEM 75 / OB3b) TaxID=595536 RepID=A0A2D2CZV4_METT3|nr:MULTISPECIES: ABC transporter permease [Methylosinus]ATQ68291.1 ABC transporter [Methylosinus trichosporium OB3b]OBS50968.1 ABC transporter [Methylosinus sp. 3S-1]